MGYTVCRDTREKQFWSFAGEEVVGLKTGDYTIKGLEDKFVIEKKNSSGEFAGCCLAARFERELCRLDEFAHPFLIIECTLYDIMNFPRNSGIPSSKWQYLKVTPQLLLKRIQEIQIDHPGIQIVFAGDHGREFVEKLFYRIALKYGIQ